MVKKILLFSILFFIAILPNINVKAYNYRGNLTTDLVRYYGANNTQVSVSNGATGAIVRPYRMAIYFNVNTYYDYGGDHYAIFTGRTYVDDVSSDTTTGSQFNTTIEPYILTDSATENPNSCFFSSTSNSFSPNGWSTISWVVTCKLDNVLHNGTYRNILYFTISNGRNGDYTNMVTTLDSDFYLVSNPFDNEGQSVINSITNQTTAITNNQNQNTQDIINNQDSNTQQQIESQNVCKNIDKSYISSKNNYINPDGSWTYSSNYGITSFIDVTYSELTVLNTLDSINPSLCFYTDTKAFISCINNGSMTVNQKLTIPSNAFYMRASIQVSQNKPTFKLCKNGNQALNDSVNGLNDSITSTDTPNTNQDIDDMNDMVASDTPITDLITMPLTLINAYINGVNSTCSPVNLGNLLGTNLTLPCINLEQRLGSNLWGIIDALFSLFMCYNIGMLFVSAFDGITSLRDDFEGLYQPRHADTGYVGKHGGGN